MKHTLLFLIAILAFMSCAEDNTPGNLEPRLFVSEATDITRTEATLQGKVVLQGSAGMPRLRFVYGIYGGNETTAVETFADNGSVSSRVSGLTPGTRYSFCLQADNGRTTVSSEMMTFSTIPNDKPTVGPLTVLSHGPVSAIVSYTITDDGGEEITETGCYVTRASDGETYKAVATASGDAGTYKIRIGELRLNTAYELKAFASNKEGETVGEALPFTTGHAVTLVEPGELPSLMGDDLYTYTSLSFAGPMNGTDLACLRQMAGIDADGHATPGQLIHIDMADVSIVAGGESYGESRYSEDNVIGYGLFADCSKLESVIMPDNVTVIERDALRGCASLRSITIPASVEQVTPSSGCSALAEILVSPANGHYQSDEGVLLNADATALVWFPMGKEGDYTLPSTITSIDDYAFSYCHVTSLTLPDGLTDVGQSAFYGCEMEEIHMPACCGKSLSAFSRPVRGYRRSFSVPTRSLSPITRLTAAHCSISTYRPLIRPYAVLTLSAVLPPRYSQRAYCMSRPIVFPCTGKTRNGENSSISSGCSRMIHHASNTRAYPIITKTQAI